MPHLDVRAGRCHSFPMTVAVQSRPQVGRPAHLARLPELTRHVVASGGARATIRSPLDLEPIGEIPRSRAEDVKTAAAQARRVQEDWAQRPFAERADVFLRFHDLLLERQEEALDLIQLESGKSRTPRLRGGRRRGDRRPPLRGARRRLPLAAPAAGRRARPHPDLGVPPPEGPGRRHRALELPAVDGDHRRHPGAHRRQRGGREARLADPLHPALGDRPDGRGGAARGSLRGRLRRRRDARHADLRRRRLPPVHRLDRHRSAGREGGGRAPDRLLARARRQEPDAGARRRRPRERGDGRRARLLRLRRPALRLDRADLRPRNAVQPLPLGVRRGDPGDPPRHPPRLELRRRLARLREADEDGRGARPGRRRQGREARVRRPPPGRRRPARLRTDAVHRRPARA